MTDKVPMYEGKNTSLLEEPRCVNCCATPATKLLRCSRCHVAWYCTPTCQKAHYAGKHRSVCKKMAKHMNTIQQHGRMLRNNGIGAESVFETETGYFWDMPQTMAYMDATYDVADGYWAAARESEVKQVYEKALFYLLENLRLGATDNLGSRLRVPFLLLLLNRDDDAYCFVRYWCEIDDDLNVALQQMHANSVGTKEGDWIYARETDCRYGDMFQNLSNRELRKVERLFLVAMVIIKLRIVAAHEAAVQAVELAMSGTAGQRIQEVQSTILGMLVREDVNVTRLRQYINRMLDTIHLQNPSMLPALINPKPIIDQPPPTRIITGHPSEIYRIIDCAPCFQQVPGAVEMLQERFGSDPVYAWDWSS